MPASPTRHLNLSGASNFRDLGGYPARDGRVLKRRLIWRSARLDELTSDDIRNESLDAISTIADLRLASERALHPTVPAFAEKRTTLVWDEGDIDLSGDQRLFARDLKPEPEELPKIEAKIENGLPDDTSSAASVDKKKESGKGG